MSKLPEDYFGRNAIACPKPPHDCFERLVLTHLQSPLTGRRCHTACTVRISVSRLADASDAKRNCSFATRSPTADGIFLNSAHFARTKSVWRAQTKSRHTLREVARVSQDVHTPRIVPMPVPGPMSTRQEHRLLLLSAAAVHQCTDARKTTRILPLCATFRAARRRLRSAKLVPHGVVASQDRTRSEDERAIPKPCGIGALKNGHFLVRLLFSISTGQCENWLRSSSLERN
jgi:hypothetical protein